MRFLEFGPVHFFFGKHILSGCSSLQMAFVTSRSGWVSDFIFVGSFYYDNEDDYNCESALLFAYVKATRAAKELR